MSTPIVPSIYTRTMFCPICFKEHRPDKETTFFLYGQTRKIYSIYTIKVNMPISLRGFTPHIVTNLGMVKDKICVSTVCCVNGCGVDITKKKGDLEINQVMEIMSYMTPKQWRALVAFKDWNYYIGVG